MPPRKRTRAEMEATEPPQEKREPSLLQRIRSMWEFAAVMQYIYLFGKAVKIDEDFDIEDFEEECLKPGYSEKLEDIGLTLLKWISSHRGLTLEIWDEYVRRQYVAKAPHRNPYGEEEEPKKFRSFDIFQKIKILHQLTTWTFWNPDRLRERMPEHQKESEQLEWRIEPFGWDSDEREYYVLDDNRMYRRTEPPLPTTPKAKPKSNTLKARAARRRASKRRKLDHDESETEGQGDGDASQIEAEQPDQNEGSEGDTYGGYKWECVAISLNDFNEFIESIRKTKDPNEKELRQRIVEDVLPVIEAAAEKQRRKQERRERELMFLEKMAGAKRSSRLADKQEREKKEIEEAEAARKREKDLAAAHREQDIQRQMEEERRSRMMTREQRIKDREYKRLLKEEELARDEEEQKLIEEGEKRGSERQIRERMEKNKKELEDLEAEEDWTFDCSGCGKHGKNYDDGSHSVACERCNVWQHSKCLGISKSAAEKDDFHFICGDCRKKEEEAKRPKIMLKFGTNGHSSSPPQPPSSPVKHHQPGRFAGVEIPPISASILTSPTNNPPNQASTFARPASSSSNHQAQAGDPFRNRFGPPIPRDQTSVQRPQQTPNGTHTVPDSHSNRQAQSSSASALVHSTPRPSSNHDLMSGSFPVPARVPSPVINRPTISPTQGNPEVGPIAGVPGSSPATFHPALFTPHSNGATPRPQNQDQQINGQYPHRTSISPRQSYTSHTPNPQHLSGLSPVKQRVNSPLPPPSNIPEKSILNHTSSQTSVGNANSFNTSTSGTSTFRSFSGTPIFPPAEKLAPSPEQINREPVPTPSKQPSPIMIGGELRRVSGSRPPSHVSNINGNVQQQQQQPTTALVQTQVYKSQNGDRDNNNNGQQS